MEKVLNIEFDTDIDLDNAANDVRERVARIVGRLPAESEAPRILTVSYTHLTLPTNRCV